MCASVPPPTIRTPSQQVEKEKRKHRRMLLSRLKNRNKTAPAPSPPPHNRPQVLEDRPPVSQNSWISPNDALASASTTSGMSIITVSSRSSEASTGGPGRRQMAHDPMEGLPDLPKIQHSLPSIKGAAVGKCASSTKHKVCTIVYVENFPGI